jgi:hypothetical protein
MLDDDLPTEEETRFYAALGRAITAWADIEEVLFAITLFILGCTRERAAIVFYRTPSVDARISLTNDLVCSFFPKHEPGEQPDPGTKRWREIQAELRDNLPTRNRLAHHSVGPIVDLREQEPEIIHASHLSHGERLRKGEADPLEINDIRAHRQVVSRIVNDLRNFYRQECRKPPPARGE